MHTCGNISISEILYHYHNMENYITIIDILIILHITRRIHSHYHWSQQLGKFIAQYVVEL